MGYEKLSKLFYKKDENDYTNELNIRKNSYGSYLTPLTVKGFRKGQNHLMNSTNYFMSIFTN